MTFTETDQRIAAPEAAVTDRRDGGIYVERRRAEDKTDREIKRCLKRYVTRQLFRQLEHPTT